MSLEAQLISIEHASERRGKQRRTLYLDVDSMSGTDASRAAIRNLSEFGFLLETEMRLSPGEVVQVTLPRTGPVPAKVVWVKDSLFGCEFKHALTSGEIAAARLRANIDAPAPGDFDVILEDGWSKRTKGFAIMALGIASWAVMAGVIALVS